MKKIFYIAISLFTICLSSCSDEATARSDTPLTRVAASKHLDIPLPSSAHSIYYLDYVGGLQDLERYIRFDVAPEELDSAVDALVASNNKMMGRALTYSRAAISTADLPSPRKEFLPMSWWDPGLVTTGYYRGHSDAYSLRILVDQGHSRIYIHQND